MPIFVTTTDGHRHLVKPQGNDESDFNNLVNLEGPYSKGWVELDISGSRRSFVNLRHVITVQLTEEEEQPPSLGPVFTDE